MTRFSNNYRGLGIFLWIIAIYFAILFKTAGHPYEAFVALGVAAILSAICFSWVSATIFDSHGRDIRYRRGFWPWVKEREIRYDDVEKLFLDAHTTSSGHGTTRVYDLRIFVKGNPQPILAASEGQEGAFRLNTTVEILSQASRIPVEKSAKYLEYLEWSVSTQDQRSLQARWTLGGAAFCLTVGAYFTAAHNLVPVPFAAQLQGLYANKNNVGPGIQYIAWIAGAGLGMVGTANYYQSRGR